MTSPDRRTFLKYGCLAGASLLGGASLLEACGSGSSKSTAGGSSSGSKKLAAMNYRLGWLKNFEFAGSYLADSRGYYKDENLNVTLEASGPNDSIEPQVVAGRDLVATSFSETVAPAILAGASIVVIGAIYQKAPSAIISRTNNAIHEPKDMYGKTIGVGASSQSAFEAFCKIAGVDATKIKTVPVQSDPTPLATGTVDGWLGYVMDEPSTLRAKGVDVTTMLFADFGFNMYESVYIATRAALKDHRDMIKRFMRAEIRGWQDSIRDPAAGATLAVNNYGKDLGLDPKAQALASAAQNQIIVTNDPKRGILTLDPAILDATIKTLADNGVAITKDRLYDTSLLQEVYAGKASL